MMRRRIGVLVIASGAALVLGACGDDDDADDDGASTSIEATSSEFQFAPNSWNVSAGEEFTIEFENDGSMDHEWAVLKLGDDIESGDEFAEDKVLLEVEAVPAGESTDEQFTIEDPGTYQVICALEGHFDAGMEGTLTVE